MNTPNCTVGLEMILISTRYGEERKTLDASNSDTFSYGAEETPGSDTHKTNTHNFLRAVKSFLNTEIHICELMGALFIFVFL